MYNLNPLMITTKAIWLLLWLYSLAFCLVNGNAADDVQVDEADDAAAVDHAQLQIDWLRSMGGYVSEKFSIGKLDPDDPKSVSGVFASSYIMDGELILTIPRACIIDSGLEHPEWICETTQNLIRELRLGNDSKYAPYVNYINSQPYGQLPSMWSEAGKDLLLKVTGGERYKDNQILPPDGPVGWLDDEWINECEGSDDPFEQNAFLTVVQRSWDDLLLPVYDMMSHRNGDWLNTKSNSVRTPGEDVYVRASRDIKAGEQLYTSYNKCEDCGGRRDSYGTPELLRDYAFVEMMPQQWCFHEWKVGFTLDHKYNEDGTVADGLDLEWLKWNKPLDEEGFEFFEEQIERLTKLQDTHFLKYHKEEGVPEHEWRVVKDFVEAYIVALTSLLAAQECSDDEGSCKVSSATRYDPLDTLVGEDVFNIEGCDRSISLDFSDYVQDEVIQSPYQKITFDRDPVSNDVCFSLETILQICGSYRPHYHEMVVDYTARYLPKNGVKRVLWVGGGDSMLLHDILKYESVELAVGLELDQAVTRYAFKHFGSSPHWFDERVQWWYGDASKSLLMLPAEWYGTFDLVLVDLSETVMSMSVTDDLDILGALSLLLKPEGIFLKNEMYLEKMSELFKYTVQLDYYDVPRLCSQCLVFGSNSIDFLRQELTDHQVNSKLNTLKQIDEKHYEIWNDYIKNPSSESHCKKGYDEPTPSKQESSPGIILIAECSTKILSPAEVAQNVTTHLESYGFTTVVPIRTDKLAFIVVDEGYVTARIFPEHQHVSFDIHLWSKYRNFDQALRAVQEALEASHVSSFKIVAGGMFGVMGWQEDEMTRGPKFTQECTDANAPVAAAHNAIVGEKSVIAVLEESMKLHSFQSVVALAVCGPDGSECVSDVAADGNGVEKVVIVQTCPSLVSGAQYQKDGADLMLECEKEISSTIKDSLSKGQQINVILFDTSANFEMAQILHKIIEKARSNQDTIAHDAMILAPILDAENEAWRRILLDKCLEIFFQRPAFRSEVLFNTTESSMEMGTFLTGDANFVLNLEKINAAIEARSGMVADVRNIHAGAPSYQKDFVPSQNFLPGDFDQSAPLKQWKSQQPLGYQTVFQLILEDPSVYAELLSQKTIMELLDAAVNATGIQSKPHRVFTMLGAGCLILADWDAGDVAVLYDGRAHVDLNLFTYKEDPEFASKFSRHFAKAIPSLKISLRDEMSRGSGNVVNFARDFKEPRQVPHWAKHLEKEN